RFGIAGGQLLAGRRDQAAHAVCIEEIGVDDEAVAAVGSGDRVVTVTRERLAQFRDVDVDGLSRRRRGRDTPELVDQPLPGYELVRVQEQNGQHDPLLHPAQGKRATVLEYLQRPENPKLHKCVLPLPEPHWKRSRIWQRRESAECSVGPSRSSAAVAFHRKEAWSTTRPNCGSS